jgi:hypothetical protein
MGTASIYIFISVFGGGTLLLFLVCFCCQRKLQARTLAMADITDVEGQRRMRCAARNQRRSDTHSLITAIITPPPDYATVIRKDSALGPPTYDAAVAGLKANGHI